MNMEKTNEITRMPAVERLMAEIEEKVVLNYTLADAIREGSKVTGKQEQGWIQGDNACALGAAYIAAQARGYVT